VIVTWLLFCYHSAQIKHDQFDFNFVPSFESNVSEYHQLFVSYEVNANYSISFALHCFALCLKSYLFRTNLFLRTYQRSDLSICDLMVFHKSEPLYFTDDCFRIRHKFSPITIYSGINSMFFLFSSRKLDYFLLKALLCLLMFLKLYLVIQFWLKADLNFTVSR